MHPISVLFMISLNLNAMAFPGQQWTPSAGKHSQYTGLELQDRELKASYANREILLVRIPKQAKIFYSTCGAGPAHPTPGAAVPDTASCPALLPSLSVQLELS